jgi:hypothetical protein
MDGRMDGEPDGHHHTIIRPVFNGRIKKGFIFSILHLKHCVKSKKFYTNNLLIFWSGFDQFSFFPMVYNDKIKMVEKSRTFFFTIMI